MLTGMYTAFLSTFFLSSLSPTSPPPCSIWSELYAFTHAMEDTKATSQIPLSVTQIQPLTSEDSHQCKPILDFGRPYRPDFGRWTEQD